jgi:hypothetical protein
MTPNGFLNGIAMDRNELEDQHGNDWVVAYLEGVFDEYSTRTERANALLSRMGVFYKEVQDVELVRQETIESGLKQCASILDNKKEFVDGCLRVLKPLLEFIKDHPAEIERAQRRAFVLQENFTPLNEIFSYGIGHDNVHIHMAPARRINFLRIVPLFRDALRKLCDVVRQNPPIQRVRATSHLVAKHPHILQRFGFAIEGPLDEEERQRHFRDFDGPIHAASMSRDELLERYGDSDQTMNAHARNPAQVHRHATTSH